MDLFENIYYDLLVEGKSPEEILSILKYKFKNVPESVIEHIFNIDPTKKKSYTQWVLMHYDNEKHIVDNALRDGTLKKLFEYFQNTPDAQTSKYKTLEEALYLVSNIDLLAKDGTNLENDFDIVYKSPEWVIAVPNTYEAEHKLGENTDWCTAGYRYSDGRGYYNNYLRNYGGKYFINFDFRKHEHLNGVDYPFKRYQFHFESNQWMDAEDSPVTLEDIDITKGAYDFYVEEGYDFNKMNRGEREERYREERFDDGVRITDELWLLQEYDHDNLELSEDGAYNLYDCSVDEMDPISDYALNKQPLYINESKGIFIFNGCFYNKTKNISGLTEYHGDGINDDNCQPVILTSSNYEKYELLQGITFYKIIEDYGECMLVFSQEKKVKDYTNKFPEEKKIKTFNVLNNNYNLEINLPFNNLSEINDVYINDEVGGIYNSFESDFVFELVWSNGYHSLINIDSNDNIDLLIKSDKPVNNSSLFTTGETEEGFTVILGTLRNYDTNFVEEEDSKLISHVEKDLFYNNLCVVVMTDKTYNVFDTETKQLIFPSNFKNIKLYGSNEEYIKSLGIIIALDLNNKQSIYSLNNGKKLTNDFDIIDYFEKGKLFGACNGDSKTTHEYYIINLKMKEFGPFYGLTSTCNNNKIFVKVYNKEGGDGGNRLLNCNTGEFDFKNFGNLSPIRANGLPIMGAQSSNGNCCLINYDNKDILDDDIMPGKIDYFDDSYLKNYCVIRHATTGKLNILSFIDGSKLLPNDVDNISTNSKYRDYDIGHYTRGGYIAFRNDNTEYILKVMPDGETTILPTPMGITTGQTTNVYNYEVRGNCIDFIIHDSRDTKEIHVRYNYEMNNIVVINEFGDGLAHLLKTCKPEIQNRVMQALQPQKAQVVNAYNEMIKRMKNLI